MSSLLPSMVRTVVPLIVGWLLSWPVVDVLDLTQTQLTTAVTAAVTAVYYVFARVVEAYVWPRFGAVLVGLGVPAPSYRHLTDGRHELGRDGDGGDAGSVRVLVVMVVAVLSVAALAAVPASAAADRRAHEVVAPRVVSADACPGTGYLEVTYDATALRGRQWVPLLDDAAHPTRLEIHDYSGRWGTSDGKWLPMPVTHAMEHWVQWTGYQHDTGQGAHYDKVRAVTGGYVSVPLAIADRCAG